ncbi:ABC transporter C member 13 [Coemansia sp. S146]|nr:ABC transporter C member 13 [Coemansia sp. S146]
MKLHKLRQVTLEDMWPLPERFQLRTAYSELNFNTSESYFVIRAIFRMTWRPMIPVHIVGLLLQFVPLIRIKLNSSIMQNVDDLSNYSMYMIIADVTGIMIVQLLDNQQSIARDEYEWSEYHGSSSVSEVEMTQGTGKLVGKIAYLEQQPWIMNATLRANILFGREYDEDYYWEVLSACALTDDLEMWPNSDMTVIGENGMNISGGQRARLALARTVYSKADIYFLDDPLSAVDAIVKRHILDNIILSTGLLGNKLRFVTTNADNILPLCNQIATVDDGCVSVKVQTPQVHTAFEFKAAPQKMAKDVDNTSKELQLGKEEKKDHDHSKSLVDNGAQMIRLFGVESYFTSNYIKSAERTTRLAMVRSAYFDLDNLVSTATKTALRSILLYVYIAMSKIGLYMVSASDIAEFRENCGSMSRRIYTISSLSTSTLELLAKINAFRNLAERDAEAPYVNDSCRPSSQWPPNGKIEFRDFSMKYGADLGYALKKVNLTINPGEKIGIVGRTGAGKSSLAKVLFRLVHENTSGSILIDGQDISEFGVGDYRPQLGMIPQESTMLDGSIRHNLDPLNQFDIEEMWASLVKCNMAKVVSPYRSSGASSGQKQLFSLCRVIMRKRRIIVLDEATANVDLETDKSIQELIRKEFSDCTVLTIAHRLDTIMNSDRIVVMDKGTVAEIGTPQELLAKDGMFAQLVKTSEFGQ